MASHANFVSSTILAKLVTTLLYRPNVFAIFQMVILIFSWKRGKLSKKLSGNLIWICRRNASFFHFKGERKNFLQNCWTTTHATVFRQRTFFSIIKLVWRETWVLFILLQCYFERRVLFKKTQSSIEIDVIVDKNICLFKFRWKVCKITVKKKES